MYNVLLILTHKQHNDNTIMAKDILHMRIDADLKEALKQLAEQENRNLSNLIETVLREYVKTHLKSV